MAQLLPSPLGQPIRRVSVDSDAARGNYLAERASQGLAAHLTDPAAAARIVTLLLPSPARLTLRRVQGSNLTEWPR